MRRPAEGKTRRAVRRHQHHAGRLARLLDQRRRAGLHAGRGAGVFRKGHAQFHHAQGSALNARALAERYEFRTTTVAENLENLDYIHARIRSFNVKPDLKFVITLSPVPLKGSFEFESAMYADCLSKSTLRVVAHEFIKTHGTVLYWPSFEIVKWLGAHIGPFYGVDDGASWHISEDLVHVITDLFIEHFSATA